MKTDYHKRINLYIIAILVVFLVIVAFLIRRSPNLFQSYSISKTHQSLSSKITPIVIPTSTSIQTKQIQYITPTIDPDPMVDCKFTYLGTIRLKSSVCSKSTDCQIGKKWIYYDSVDKCKADQNAYWQQNIVQSGQKENSYFDQDGYNRQLSEVKIDCSLNSPPYSYNFGQLTYNDCKQKSDAYFAQKKAELGSTSELGHLEKSLQGIYDLVHATFAPTQHPSGDFSIHMDPTPTCRWTPYGCFSN